MRPVRPALAIMAKEPVPGRTKTRLEPLLGPEGAARLYRCLLLDTIELAAAVPDVDVILAIDPATSGAYFTELAPGLPQLVQTGAALGDRLDNVLAELLDRGHPAAAAIGSDAPTLPPDHIAAAFRRLAEGDADTVLGPADDGGYHLIAVTSRPGPVTTEVTMSTPEVLADTMAVAERTGRRVALGPPWYDVDEPAD
ncbi:MAG: TIGR04282 family arsenosugar biosynthesis glycosyltransferase, partial [Actinomycetota bacterium]